MSIVLQKTCKKRAKHYLCTFNLRRGVIGQNCFRKLFLSPLNVQTRLRKFFACRAKKPAKTLFCTIDPEEGVKIENGPNKIVLPHLNAQIMWR